MDAMDPYNIKLILDEIAKLRADIRKSFSEQNDKLFAKSTRASSSSSHIGEFHPNIDMVPAMSAPAIYDEPVLDGDMESDASPVFDEENSDSTIAGVGIVFFDQGPLVDEEPDDITNVGCDLVIFTTAMFDHNEDQIEGRVAGIKHNNDPDLAVSTAIYDAMAPAEVCAITREVVPVPEQAAVALTTICDVSGNINIDALANCSTMCPSHITSITTIAVVNTIAEEVYVLPDHVPAPSMPGDTTTTWSDAVLSEGCFSYLNSGLLFQHLPRSPTLFCIRESVHIQGFKLLITEAPTCASLDAHQVFDEIRQGAVLNIFSLECVPCDEIFLQPWPPLMLLTKFHMDGGNLGNMELSWLWKPPWPPPVLLNIAHDGIFLRLMPWPSFRYQNFKRSQCFCSLWILFFILKCFCCQQNHPSKSLQGYRLIASAFRLSRGEGSPDSTESNMNDSGNAQLHSSVSFWWSRIAGSCETWWKIVWHLKLFDNVSKSVVLGCLADIVVSVPEAASSCRDYRSGGTRYLSMHIKYINSVGGN